ncbi:transcription factor TFIIIB subunit brf1 [Actinomortierella ambigua]|uniref:B-related factor 1 n=1 Tax=Actinomortierella ambigua TaxID=1343610 RepID=A0A9P6Q3S1_9FUNG|nr:transcription factor TFIIIB subunit brf1 [Actinomortierella ambigua]
MACPFCGASSIEYDGTQGNATCTTCGAVLEENTIVAEVTFSESAGGAASVVGTFVAEGKAGIRSAGPGRRQTSQESRERTLENARRKIQNMAVALRLNEHHAEVAQRYFNLAISNNFIQGRRSDHVVACCLYIVCRMEKTPHMLIDFSELLQQLNLRLPLVDPSLYISRFAAMLDFGEDTHRVAHDALRLVSRMDRDWIRTGRRPAGICGACLLIAARMHHYRRSQKEIIQVVKIGEATLRKRLDEFAVTASGQLSVADFREMWLEDAADPPSFAKARKRHFEEGEITTTQDGQTHITKRRGSRIIHRGSISAPRPGQEQPADAAAAAAAATGTTETQPQGQGTLSTIAEVSAHGATEESASRADNQEEEMQEEQEQEERGDAEDEEEGDHEAKVKAEDANSQIPKAEQLEEEQAAAEEEEVEMEILEEVEEEFEDEMLEEMDAVMNDPYMKQESDRLDAEDEARKLIPFEPLEDVDDDEIESIILNDDEVRVKTQVWLELNKDYLREQEQKRVRIEMEKKMGIYHKKGRKKNKRNQHQQSSSVAEAGRLLLAPKLPKQKSKKINYEALESMDDLFDTKPNFSRHGSPAPMKSIFEEPSLSTGGSAYGAGGVGTPGTGTQGSSTSRHGSVSREGSARPPGRLSSLSRMIKSSSGGSRPKFSSGGSVTTPMGSRSISREPSVLGTRPTDGREPGAGGRAVMLDDEDDEDEIAPPPASAHRQREMAAAAAAASQQKQQQQQQQQGVGEEEEEIIEEEEEDGGAWSWQKQMGYDQVDEMDYADEYDQYNDYEDD